MSPATAEPDVLYEVDGHVATLTLNRPHRYNAITSRMLGQLGEHLTAAERDRAVRCVILTGAGKGFCSGLDLQDTAKGEGLLDSPGDDEGIGGGGTGNVRDLPTTILNEMDKPVIAAVNGPAAGYGLDLALGCDMRLMASSAKLVPGFAKRGILPESGGTWYLPRLVGWAKACEIGFLGRNLDAAESEQMGLVNLVIDDDELMATTTSWAEEIAANAPLAVQAIKRMYRHGLTENFAAHSHHVLVQLMELLQTKDFGEGVASYIEKRPPEFTGR